MFRLQSLHNQQVRDLGYSCFSEPLISRFSVAAAEDVPKQCSLTLTEKRMLWLQQLDNQPASLINYLQSVQPRRLGHYHEALWHFFLQQDEDVELVAHNCQVMQGANTLGEFDVIYRYLPSGNYVHLELAFKLYLQAPRQIGHELSHWLGPNVKDRLDLKLEHMLNHQCRLSLKEAGQLFLKSMAIAHVERQISLRGYLLHADAPVRGDYLHPVINPNHQKSNWIPVSKMIPLLEQAERWMALNRLNWISPVNCGVKDSFTPEAFACYLRDRFKRDDAALMICALVGSDSKGWSERYRIMVTADAWPGV